MTNHVESVDPGYRMPLVGDRSISQKKDLALELFEDVINNNHDTSISLGQKAKELFIDIASAYREGAVENWDGYGAKAADENALLYTMLFVEQLLPIMIHKPEFGVDVDGDMSIDWDFGPRKVLTIRVARDGTITYSSIIGLSKRYGEEVFIETIPSSILQVIEKIFDAAEK